ncbi:hypothetical protein V7O66_09030 [Methanolobus sp. ZRKC3]
MSEANVKSCSRCEAELKRQVMGINLLFYCPVCGCMTSDAFA